MDALVKQALEKVIAEVSGIPKPPDFTEDGKIIDGQHRLPKYRNQIIKAINSVDALRSALKTL